MTDRSAPERVTSAFSISASDEGEHDHDHDHDVYMTESDLHLDTTPAPTSNSNASQPPASQSSSTQSQADAQATPRAPATRNLAPASTPTTTTTATSTATTTSATTPRARPAAAEPSHLSGEQDSQTRIRTLTMTVNPSIVGVQPSDSGERGPRVTATEPSDDATPREGEMVFREEEVLLALQLLAYVSKYAHVRSLFYSDECFSGRFPRRLESYQRLKMHSSPYPVIDPSIEGPTRKVARTTLDGSDEEHHLDHRHDHDRDHDHAAPPGAEGGDGEEEHEEEGSEHPSVPTVPGMAGYYGLSAALPGVQGINPGSDKPQWSNPPSTASNVFSIAERFTIRSSRVPPIAQGRLAREIQFWAGVIMRNACRKDDERGGVRPCAYMGCGKWEHFPRQFAKCRRCRKAKYCSKQCQSLGWAAGHRFWCSARPEDEARRDAHETGTTVSVPGTATVPAPVIPAAPQPAVDPPTQAARRWVPAGFGPGGGGGGGTGMGTTATGPEPEGMTVFRFPGQVLRPPPAQRPEGRTDPQPLAALGLAAATTPRAANVVGGLTATRHSSPHAPTEPTTEEGTPRLAVETHGTETQRTPTHAEQQPMTIEQDQGQRESAIDQLRITLHETASPQQRSESGGRARGTSSRGARGPDPGDGPINPRLLAVRQAVTSAPSTAEGSEASDEEPSVRRINQGAVAGPSSSLSRPVRARGEGGRTPVATPLTEASRSLGINRNTRTAPEEIEPPNSVHSGAETDASMDVDPDQPQASNQSMRTHLLVAPAVRRTDMTGRPLPPPLIASLDADPMHIAPPRAGTPGALLRHQTPNDAPTADPQPQDNPFVDPDRELENMPWDAIEGYRLDNTPAPRREGQNEHGDASEPSNNSTSEARSRGSSDQRPSRHSLHTLSADAGHHTDTEVVDADPAESSPRSLPRGLVPMESQPPTPGPAPASRFPRRAQDDATLPIRRALPRARAASPSFLGPAGLPHQQGGYMPSPLSQQDSPASPHLRDEEMAEDEEL